MNLGLALHFKEVKGTAPSMLKEAESGFENQKTPSHRLCEKILDKNFVNQKRGRDDIRTSESFKAPSELSLDKKTLIDRILKSKQSLLSSKPAGSKPVLQSSTLAIVNKVLQKSKVHLQLPSTQPKLSQKALQVIEELSKDRKNRFERTPAQLYSRSESSFSLRLRNEELIKEERELPIPCKYKHLLNSFIALDNSINYFKQNNQPKITFSSLKDAIETTEKHRFTMNTFQQILYVVPHFFVLKWTRFEDDYDLMIDIPHDHAKRLNNIEAYEESSTEQGQFDFNKLQGDFNGILIGLKQSDLNSRRMVFKNILLELINEEHKQFLQTNQTDYPPDSFNPFRLKTWHHAFDLDNIKDIPLFSITPKPVTNPNCYEKCIKENDIKSFLLKKAFESQASPCDEDVEINDFNRNISIDLLKRLQRKENAIKISNEIIEVSHQTHTAQCSSQKMKDIVSAVANVFISRESIALNELIDILSKGLSETYLKSIKDELKKKLAYLTEQFPNWIKIIHHSSLGKVVVIDKSIKVTEEVMTNLCST